MEGKKVNADPSGIAFNSQGDLFVAVGPFREVVRIRSADLNPAKPGLAQTFATRPLARMASSLTGKEIFSSPAAPAAPSTVWSEWRRSRSSGSNRQARAHASRRQDPAADFANGVEFDANGALLVTDTARGAIWKVVIGPDGKG